jgi:hypothetical protein
MDTCRLCSCMLEIQIEATQLCITFALVATEQTRRRNNMSVNYSKQTRSKKWVAPRKAEARIRATL